MKNLKTIRGIRDIVYPESSRWDRIIDITERIFKSYGYKKIFLPVIEYTELFSRSIGEDTDIVGKEMYSFEDRKGRNLSLRPEGTAGVVRAMIENKLLQGNVREKVYYFGPMFRYERPQEGRYRQFYQLGCEVFGSTDLSQDAETAELAMEIFKECTGSSGDLLINSVGCENEDCRPRYRKKIRKYFKENEDKLCRDCKRRIETNVLRIFDCKNKSCQDLIWNIIGIKINPENRETSIASGHLCGNCSDDFVFYRSSLKERNIKFAAENRLVRGLDYYTGPVFELKADGLAVIAGGRYNNLVKQLGGSDVPACGWALGLDRLAAICSDRSVSKKIPEVYLAYLGSEIPNPGNEREDVLRKKHLKDCRRLSSKLRENNISVEEDYEHYGPSRKFKLANKKKVEWVFIFGEEEAKSKTVSIKNMKTGKQESISIEDIDGIMRKLKNEVKANS